MSRRLLILWTVLAVCILAGIVKQAGGTTGRWSTVLNGVSTTAPTLNPIGPDTTELPKPALSAAARRKVPEAAYQYQRLIVTEAHTVFGLDAPISTLASQLDQESGWRWNVKSGVGAGGLAQFMPGTAADMARMYPTELGPADINNPQWAIKAQQRYMRDLNRGFPGLTECDTWAFGLSAYNGGAGWVARDKRVCRGKPGCKDAIWFGNVEASPDTKRAPSNIKENRGYPKRILLTLTPAYVASSRGRGIECVQGAQSK